MERIRLYFKNVSEILGTEDVGIIILVEKSEERQIAITCDRNMIYQFGLRIGKTPNVETLLPEVLCRLVTRPRNHYEIWIKDIIDGEYSVVLRDIDGGGDTPMRASDAILLAVIGEVRIYTSDDLMDRQSVIYKKNSSGMSIPVNVLNEDMLNKAFEKAVKDEDYELASRLRDELKKRKRKK